MERVIKDNNILSEFIDTINEILNKNKDIKNIKAAVIGGTMRIPLFKNELLRIMDPDHFKKDVFTGLIQTLNMDECVSNGCCAFGLSQEAPHLFNYEFKTPFQEEGDTSMNMNYVSGLRKNANRKSSINETTKKVSMIKNEVESEMYYKFIFVDIDTNVTLKK